MSTDTGVLIGINDFARATPWLHRVVEFYASYGIVLFAAILLAGWWTARRRGDARVMAAALWAPAGMLLALGANQLLVAAVDRPRPYTALPHLLVLATRSTDPSFPSDHAVIAGAVAVGAVLVSRTLGVIAAAAALLMAFARVYIAAHYPLDVVVGLGFGALTSLVGYLLTRRLLAWLVIWLARGRLRALVTASVPLRTWTST